LQGIGRLYPEWIRLSNRFDYYNAYYNAPPLYSIINYMAKCFSKAKFQHVKILANGNEKEILNSPLVEKLENPNPLQNGAEFLIQAYVYWQVFGNNAIFNVTGVPNNYNFTVNLWNLPAQFLIYKTTGELWSAESIKEIVSEIYAPELNSRFAVDNILLLNESNIDFQNGKNLAGSSKIKALEKNISNIVANLETQNVFLTKRGAIGILSNNSGDAAGHIPMHQQDKENLQKDFQNYGMEADKWQIIISDFNLTWQQMSLPMRDMMLFEQWKNDIIEIANAYQFPIPLLNHFESAAGQANIKQFDKQLYTNKIIPDWKMFERELNMFFKLSEKSEKIKITYDDIEALQSDRNEIAQIGTAEITVIEKNSKSNKHWCY
jgi:phage portal protein BeeE